MTDTCTCPPGDCHGGHTINIGPAWVCVPDERLRQLRDDPFATRPETVTVDPETQAMAAELLALRTQRESLREQRRALLKRLDHQDDDVETLRARITELEAERGGWQKLSANWHARYSRAVRELRARITELEGEVQADERAIEEARDERDAARERAAELEAAPVAELIGYAVASTAGQDDYLCLASDLLHRRPETASGELVMAQAGSPSAQWRVVELREVAAR